MALPFLAVLLSPRGPRISTSSVRGSGSGSSGSWSSLPCRGRSSGRVKILPMDSMGICSSAQFRYQFLPAAESCCGPTLPAYPACGKAINPSHRRFCDVLRDSISSQTWAQVFHPAELSTPWTMFRTPGCNICAGSVIPHHQS